MPEGSSQISREVSPRFESGASLYFDVGEGTAATYTQNFDVAVQRTWNAVKSAY